MKKVSYLLLLLMTVFSLAAQDQDRDQARLQDRVILKDGKVLLIRDRDQVQLRDPIKLHDGSVVNLDGTYQTLSGRQQRLQEGECLDMDGNWYSNETQFRQRLNDRTQAM